ncbi:MAG: hypothetical protein PHQ00_01805, partial [Phycisphaerae bacterium]|nr:hypothetical protein [Phycisphaerae bacterium]
LRQQEDRSGGYEERIKKQKDLFKCRDVIPSLHKVIFECIPNAENNSAQAELYRAYEQGDVAKIMAIPRNERKQVFITSININYADSLLASRFEVGRFGTSSSSASQSEQELDGKGFTVVIEGYSPYEKIGEIMDPVGVGNDKSRWGIITRMTNLNDIFDGNSPFKLFAKEKVEHFWVETGPVDIADTRMPAGIGILRLKSESLYGSGGYTSQTDASAAATTRQILVDPLTEEEIHKTVALDEKGRIKYDVFGQPLAIERDKWFRIKAKFLWTEGKAGRRSDGTADGS